MLSVRVCVCQVAGILGQEALGVTPKWFEAGAKDYGTPLVPLLAIEFLIMGFLETKRYQGFKETGTVSGAPCNRGCGRSG